eukprot:364850-Chlamydomonas_euryale.AAC.7
MSCGPDVWRYYFYNPVCNPSPLATLSSMQPFASDACGPSRSGLAEDDDFQRVIQSFAGQKLPPEQAVKFLEQKRPRAGQNYWFKLCPVLSFVDKYHVVPCLVRTECNAQLDNQHCMAWSCPLR